MQYGIPDSIRSFLNQPSCKESHEDFIIRENISPRDSSGGRIAIATMKFHISCPLFQNGMWARQRDSYFSVNDNHKCKMSRWLTRHASCVECGAIPFSANKWMCGPKLKVMKAVMTLLWADILVINYSEITSYYFCVIYSVHS